MAKGDEIAKAIKTSLMSASGPLVNFSTGSVSERHQIENTPEAVARIEEGGEKTELVTVIPLAERKVRSSRSSYFHEYDIGVCVQCFCKFEDQERVEELNTLVESIGDYLGVTGRTMSGASHLRMEIAPLFDRDKLHDDQQFFSMPIFTYRIER